MAESGAATEPAGASEVLLGRRVQAAVIAGFVLLLFACGAAVVLANRARDADGWVTHTLSIRQGLQSLSSLVVQAESAQRSFLLTGDKSYLAPLDQARAALPALQNSLIALTADNPGQNQRLRSIGPLITERMGLVDRSVTQATRGQREAAIAIVRSGRGQSLMDAVQTVIAAADREEADLYAARTGDAARERTNLVMAMVGSTILATALMVAVGIIGRRYTASLLAANAALRREAAERERAQAHLRQAQKVEAIGRLTGGVAHDFNNILAIVIGNLDMALSRIAGDARYRKQIENAQEGAKRGATLTQRLLAFSRLQPLDPKPTDVNKTVQQMSELLVRALGEMVQIETVLAAGLWPANVDATQLESAILNLAVNARDAMPHGGRLTLETANTFLDAAYAKAHQDVASGQYVMIAVTDTGEGMSQSVIDSAFDPFFTTKPAGAGTGLGLSQVHGFVRQTGGHVKLYSEPGHGTTVKIYLPRHSVAAPAEEAEKAPAQVAGAKLKVLVVEDEAGVRAFVVDALQELGHAVLEAPGGVDGLRLLEANGDIDLLLTDVIMPGINGRQLADRARMARPDLPVLYMTGYTRNAIVHNGVLDPGTHLLTKPFTLQQLDTEIRAAMLRERARA
jgi:signal transduction histidine kinase